MKKLEKKCLRSLINQKNNRYNLLKKCNKKWRNTNEI